MKHFDLMLPFSPVPLLSLLVLALGSSACKAQSGPEAGPTSKALSTLSPNALHDTIKSMTANLGCQSNNQCQSVGLGQAPCGGPETFIVYSTAHIKPDKLKVYVEAYNKKRKMAVQESGMMGICLQKMPPLLSCVSKRCVAQNDKTPL